VTYAKIESVEINNGNAVVNLKVAKDKLYGFRIVTENGEELPGLVQQKRWTVGQAIETISIGHLPKGLYYVQLLFDDQLIHFQELEKM